MFWYNFTDCGTVVASVDDVDIAPDNTESITVNGKVWKMAYILQVSNLVGRPLLGTLKFRTTGSPIQLFDIRLYGEEIKNYASIMNYFEDVKGNHGNAYLPSYISL